MMQTILAVFAGFLIIPAFIVVMCIAEAVEERMSWKSGVVMNVLFVLIAPIIAFAILATLGNWWKS